MITFTWPPDGAFFDWGDELAWSVRVDDAEDGSTVSGGIAPGDVLVDALLGHDTHGHGLGQFSDVSGTVLATNDHDFAADLYFAFRAAYEDRGAPGVGRVTGRGAVTLQPKCRQAEHYTAASGITIAATSDPAGGGFDVASIDHGDFVSFSPMNLLNIHEVGFRLASAVNGARIEVHADAPGGPLLATVPIPNTGGVAAYGDCSAPIVDPGGTRELFFVFLRAAGDTALCRVNWICFSGPRRDEDGQTAASRASARGTPGKYRDRRVR